MLSPWPRPNSLREYVAIEAQDQDRHRRRRAPDGHGRRRAAFYASTHPRNEHPGVRHGATRTELQAIADLCERRRPRRSLTAEMIEAILATQRRSGWLGHLDDFGDPLAGGLLDGRVDPVVGVDRGDRDH